MTELRNIFLLTIRLRHTGTHDAFGSKIHHCSSKSICPIKRALVLNLGETPNGRNLQQDSSNYCAFQACFPRPVVMICLGLCNVTTYIISGCQAHG